MSGSRAQLVKSAQRVLEVLEYFDDENPSATVTDIARSLSYPQSSTSVLLRCLRDMGYLYYNRTERKYRPTSRAALLGCWAEGGVYRGGKMLRVVDAVSERFGETVLLSNAGVDYAVHHLHVVRGANAGAIVMRAGLMEPVVYSVQGELVLSSYPDPQIRLALHRLNAEEPNPERRVSITAKLDDLHEMRARGGWNIGYVERDEPIGVVAMMMPRRKGGDRIVLSLIAKEQVVRERAEEFLEVMTQERDRVFPDFRPRTAPTHGASAPVALRESAANPVGNRATDGHPPGVFRTVPPRFAVGR
jgi:DNA-binding IclR family transcriptional regulator